MDEFDELLFKRSLSCVFSGFNFLFSASSASKRFDKSSNLLINKRMTS